MWYPRVVFSRVIVLSLLTSHDLLSMFNILVYCDASQGVVRQGPTRGRQETIEPPASPYTPLGRIHEHQYIPHYRCTVAGPWTAYTRKTHLMPPAPRTATTHSLIQYIPHTRHTSIIRRAAI